MALLTAGEAKETIVGLSGTGSDTLIDKLIAAVGVAIALHLGYPRIGSGTDATVESASYVVYTGGYEGCVIVDGGDRLLLPAKPCTAVASIYDDPNQDYAAATLVSSSDYAIDAVDGVVRLKPTRTHGGWSSSEYAIKVTCTAGFVTLPTDIKQAARWCVRHWWEINGRGLSEQISAEGVSITPPSIAIPKLARDLLVPYRLSRGWIA